jgi:hypothetical protein
VLPTPPSEQNWDWAISGAVSIYANGPSPDNPPQIKDGCGCCFWAACAHGIQCKSANANLEIVPTVKDVIDAYVGCCHFDLNNPTATDVGTDMIPGMDWMNKVGMAGHKFGPSLSVDPTKPDQIALANYLGGGLIVGVQFRENWENVANGGTWDGASPYAGGHALWNQRIKASLGIGFDSWAEDFWMPWANVATDAIAIMVSVDPIWIDPVNNQAPNGFDAEQLLADLKQIAGNTARV